MHFDFCAAAAEANSLNSKNISRFRQWKFDQMFERKTDSNQTFSKNCLELLKLGFVRVCVYCYCFGKIKYIFLMCTNQ